jgi:hypothetical protein
MEFEGGINLWVKAYSTNYGNKARITVSYLEEAEWKNTLALWLNKKLCIQLTERLKKACKQPVCVVHFSIFFLKSQLLVIKVLSLHL